MLTTNLLIYNKGHFKKEDFIFFWKQQKYKNKPIGKGCLSQWYMSDFIIDGIRYCCAEQYMMAKKAELFGDYEIYSQILNTNKPKEIKSLGRKVKNFLPAIWEKHKVKVVFDANFAKFSQNKELREYLCATEKLILVEASPYDTIWGIGLAEDEPYLWEPNLWLGKNLLGFVLMDVRDKIIFRSNRTELIHYNRAEIDENTGETIISGYTEINEDYLPDAETLWNTALEQEQDRLNRESPVSEELKKFLKQNIDVIQNIPNIDTITQGELINYLDQTAYGWLTKDYFSVEKEGDGYICYYGLDNGPLAGGETISCTDTYSSFSEALEQGARIFILEKVETKQLGGDLYDSIKFDKKSRKEYINDLE